MGALPDEIRLRYLYRSIIMRGRVRLPLAAAQKLVGPDCAYHLYGLEKEPSVALPETERPEDL